MTEMTFEELKRKFEKGGPNVYQGGKQKSVSKYAVFNEIGRLATQGDENALRFVEEHLSHADPFLRYAAVGYLGNTPAQHLKQINIDAIEKLRELAASEKDEIIFNFINRIILEKTRRKM